MNTKIIFSVGLILSLGAVACGNGDDNGMDGGTGDAGPPGPPVAPALG